MWVVLKTRPHKVSTMGSLLVIFGTFGTVLRYTSYVWYTKERSVFSTLASLLVSFGSLRLWHFCTFYVVQVIAQSTAEI